MTTRPLSTARRVVLKVGSSLLVGADGHAARDWLAALAADVAAFRESGREVVVVSSGAIALGRRSLGMSGKMRLEEKQAAAAAGQARLMRAWEEAFAPHGVIVAQALLTPEDTERRRRWLNARATLETLLEHKAVPVINENDTVATQEIRYGDNDRLAARVAQMISADALILLSDVDGLYDADPRRNPNARHIPEVASITAEIEAMAGGSNATAAVGTGGMVTKIEAARIATAAGCAVAVTDGAAPDCFARLLSGERATWFLAAADRKAAYKAWIAGGLHAEGAVVIDDGAARAIGAGKSLLPAGVIEVSGAFDKGDAIRVLDSARREVARGLARYDASDAKRIMGRKSSEIESVLGYDDGAALIHADDLAQRVRA